MADQYIRQPAVKINIGSLKQGVFRENNDWQPNYISTEFGNLFRVNIVGIVIAKNAKNASFLMDDGTATINVTFTFSDNYEIKKFQDIEEGQAILLIGRPRKYGDDMYIAPEVIQRLKNLKWLQVRKVELQQQRNEHFTVVVHQQEKKETVKQNIQQVSHSNNTNASENEEISSEEEEKEEIKDSYEIIHSVLIENDKGDGVNVNFLANLLEDKNIKPGKAFITKLLEQGEIFEIKPGMIKLLE